MTLGLLELMRLRLRALMWLLDSAHQAIVDADFDDSIGVFEAIEPQIATPGVDRDRFRGKLLAFLREHQDQVVLHKLCMGRQFTALDLTELERILMVTGGFSAAEIEAGVAESLGLGMLVRSVAGMDRAAATADLGGFVGDAALTGNQLAVVNLIIDQLAQAGAVPTRLLYEALLTDFTPKGPDMLFAEAQVTTLLGVLAGAAATAEAAVRESGV